MATKLGKDEDAAVELELCLSLGGPFKKAQPLEFCTESKPNNAVRCVEDIDVDLNDGAVRHEINETRTKETRKEREGKQQQRSGGEGEYKRIRTECKEVTNGVDQFDLSFSGLGNGYRSGQYKENSKAATIGSPICSSSDVSDPSGSCELGINSDQTKPVKSPVNNITTDTNEGQEDAVVVETQEWSSSVAKETGKPPKPRPKGNGSMPPFAQMPCVTSTGNGPQGKTVNGFLHRYTKSEISIICVCHGTSFSPAEFIIHAGGTNGSHPLRHITVVPSKF
ncbi:ninja-family protein AFP3 [Brassica rapa]|uniref:Ninja-family protein n=1 Tax=Brassica campestris TaxID=3711 RepID=M4FGY9_BRACM|nr:ninja-family protein AFP3 [Brassica rapa]